MPSNARRHRRFPRSPRTEVSSLLPLSPSPPLPTRPHSAPQTRGRQTSLKPPPVDMRRSVYALQHAASPTLGKKTTRAVAAVCLPAGRPSGSRETRSVSNPPSAHGIFYPTLLVAVAGRCTEADKAALARGAITLPTRGTAHSPSPHSSDELTWPRAFYAPRRDRQPAGSLRQAYYIQ